ncbi:SALT RESISTANT 1, ABA DEFICIENT 2, GLUCOSE INSENSITIVE 1, ARABIDOPSIS THALIANA ABA DEFICIENT 2 [Hibiscus trionum]|uniref:SALT RESISTANT 1, ABA DEFICIENT 2, GLUCOSE INSENSITIVE 1, ARABIDOPSIS THALIANA ABA DEFICIENT 2 n=1 Tax=Hibiscus trionum TaxID=183268 RepID=A0A9W7JG64_HIBTR|nr:SALT RESISTANT 1, ABA DEFICIENT 2, GLUCOSE INSENSITIVE 1, ARABIDOPSIS THALIANA ABA DEFICIENT 2 [Hibiscus trionum]GMJ13934.1 SALT RESISTANT 1, ABA DEFICIENT 2, GLUCOSE INSENSITIVE 1, ARABIDOPSIS THALIANA ABA DEFICIENT 2 [Hibiscus trionum]GMJ13935.1 SALT RESISTANT 1, ABA DEFICIENT 2, GLUCOSE INSENSITIVE 1, ARABIDOPSIS THALIANA ABA DEFICIENT 2 [Hibiscus trionum]GMJ13936.1 SALT RESISTANT 1, ABA DEFICIENT 2, GLUCOSE INSENSITIVE 1, ARABIDOPSIS THALIANA ABA DEFICIENT 2 [Hibiscus trionum]GMJ13937.1 
MSSESSITKRLDGKVALITGGASGLGECTTRLFVKHGAKVLIADIQDESGHSLCQELGTENVSYVHCDVTCESDVENAVNMVVSKYGKLDIMFNNAGIIGDNEVRVTDTSTENFKRVYDINVLGGFLGAKYAARVMVPAKKGCILFTSSLASKISYGNPHAYKSSKHAVTGLTKSLAVELGEHGIRVNCISPHATATPLFQKTLGLFDKKKGEEMIAVSAVLKGTVLEPEDFANAALYLASDEAKYVSGVNLPIDGGYCLSNQSWKLGFAALSG